MTDPAKAGERGKPILFSAPMVRALLAGTKTQTRREINPQPPGTARYAGVHYASDEPESHFFNTPHGGIKVRQRIAEGDRLWVREAWAPLDALTHGDPGVTALADRGFYRADNSTVDGEISRWRPSIHMPRWASRLTLIVTDVRVQRLQDISEEDARAEGAYVAPRSGRVADDYATMAVAGHWFASARSWYADLWGRINGAGSWAANPWVVAYSFEVHHQNIDALPLPSARDAAMKEVGA